MERHTQIYSTIYIITLSFFLVPTSANKSLFIFGDAYLDTGNNDYLNVSTATRANFRPYGISFFPSPTGRFSDGRVIPDFLANHANLSFIPPFLQPGNHQFYDGVNFASGGSGALYETLQGSVLDLNMQLQNYKKVVDWFRNKLGPAGAKQRFAEAVYLFSAGGNDYNFLFLSNSSLLTTYTKSEVVDMIICNISSVVKEVYNTGGRKFAFINAPPVGCNPALRILKADGSCDSEASSYAALHNETLFRTLKSLEERLPGFKYSVFDIYDSLQKRIDHPSDYDLQSPNQNEIRTVLSRTALGLKETTAGCCGSGKFRGEFTCGKIEHYDLCENRSEYLFWDSFHFTEKTNQQFADEMWNNIHSYGSSSIKELFASP